MTTRVVIAHDWLTNEGGAEVVLRELANLYPEARIVTGVVNDEIASRLLPGRAVESLLSPRLPGVLRAWQWYAPLFLLLWSRAKLDCELLIVSSHFAAHHCNRRGGAKKVVYCHTPMRIAWRFDLEKHRLPRPLRPLFRLILPAIRAYDRRPAYDAVQFVANSHETQARIEEYYGCSSIVINPPVPAPHCSSAPLSRFEPYYLCVGRLVGYKRIDLAAEVCAATGRRLLVVGKGPLLEPLRQRGYSNVDFLGHVSEDLKWRLLAGAQALLFPGEEDFGIVPVEALSVGTPVIAYGRGGILDTVDEQTGVLFMEQTVQGLSSALDSFERACFDRERLKRRAERFSPMRFRDQLSRVISDWTGELG